MEQDTVGPETPAITIARSEHAALARLAEAMLGRSSAVAEQVLKELDRAVVLDDGEVGPEVVRIGSTVTFATDGAAARTVELVYPGEADISRGRVSVMTPIGAALLGLSAGQEIAFEGADGRERRLSVREVQPQAQGVPLP